MNLVELINYIKEVSLSHSYVESFREGDVYDINSENDNKYGMIVITPQPFTQNESTTTFNFQIFYIDRLLEDKSNKINVQNNGMKSISDIISYISEHEDIFIDLNGISYDPFTEKFADECAGVYASVTFNVSKSYSDCETLLDI